MTVTTVYCTAETGGLSANKNNGDFTGCLSGAGSESWSDNQWRHTVGHFWHSNNRANINYMVCEFDLSVIPSGDTVSDADLQLYGQQDQSSTDFDINVAEFTIASPWDSSDWQDGTDLAAYTVLDSINTSSFNASGYNTFNSSGITTLVDAKGANTSFFFWSSRTESGDFPGSSNTYESVNFYSYGQGGTTQDPKIVVTHAAGGGSTITGTGAVNAAATTASGSGSVVSTVTGAGAVSTSGPVVSGAGVREVTSSGAVSTTAASVSGSGSVFSEVTGSGSVSVAAISVLGAGAREIAGSGAVNAPATGIAGSGEVSGEITGSGAVITGPVTATGIGIREVTGSGAATTGSTVVSGAGGIEGEVAGTGAITAPGTTVSGQGVREVTGTGSAATGAATVSGAVTTPGVSVSGVDAQAERRGGGGKGQAQRTFDDPGPEELRAILRRERIAKAEAKKEAEAQEQVREQQAQKARQAAKDQRLRQDTRRSRIQAAQQARMAAAAEYKQANTRLKRAEARIKVLEQKIRQMQEDDEIISMLLVA